MSRPEDSHWSILILCVWEGNDVTDGHCSYHLRWDEFYSFILFLVVVSPEGVHVWTRSRSWWNKHSLVLVRFCLANQHLLYRSFFSQSVNWLTPRRLYVTLLIFSTWSDHLCVFAVTCERRALQFQLCPLDVRNITTTAVQEKQMNRCCGCRLTLLTRKQKWNCDKWKFSGPDVRWSVGGGTAAVGRTAAWNLCRPYLDNCREYSETLGNDKVPDRCLSQHLEPNSVWMCLPSCPVSLGTTTVSVFSRSHICGDYQQRLSMRLIGTGRLHF